MPNLRFTLRRLTATPGFTITAVLTLAVGIGKHADLQRDQRLAGAAPIRGRGSDRVGVRAKQGARHQRRTDLVGRDERRGVGRGVESIANIGPRALFPPKGIAGFLLGRAVARARISNRFRI